MLLKIKKIHLSQFLWIAGVLLIGSLIGTLTKSEINTWYSLLNRPPLTPPNYVFPIVWTLLYTIIGYCGWMLWNQSPFQWLRLIKCFYLIQLLLNWAWTPLFFSYHLLGLSLGVLISINILIAKIILLTYPRLKSVSLLMTPYFFWTLLASYLNFYIYKNN